MSDPAVVGAIVVMTEPPPPKLLLKRLRGSHAETVCSGLGPFALSDE